MKTIFRDRKKHQNLENATCGPLKYTMGSPILIVSICMGESIRIKRVKVNCWHHSISAMCLDTSTICLGVQCLSCWALDSRLRGRRSSLTCVTALCPWARHINPSLVLVQPRKTRPYISERLLMGRKESIKQTNNLLKMTSSILLSKF